MGADLLRSDRGSRGGALGQSARHVLLAPADGWTRVVGDQLSDTVGAR
ncbi:hypothetical protein [Streptomyces sp. NPDC005859]